MMRTVGVWNRFLSFHQKKLCQLRLSESRSRRRRIESLAVAAISFFS